MASVMKKCRVCGKEYEACRSANRSAGVFRWQEVACSPECGTIYLRKIEESRGIISPKVKERKRRAIEHTPVAQPQENGAIHNVQFPVAVDECPADNE